MRLARIKSTPLNILKYGIRSGLRLNKTLLNASPKIIRCARERRQPTAVEVRELFESMGVTYIKLGQFIASSPSIFPADYVEAFQNCLDQTSPLPYETVKGVLDSELGRPLTEIYSFIDKRPLASASIAQVHAATLIDGTDVVIKVQKPGVEAIINIDLNAVYITSKIMEWVSPALAKDSITDIINEIHQSMIDECDFIKEAKNLQSFNRFLQSQKIESVIAPKPILAACSKRVLTMERIYGRAFTDKSISNSESYAADISPQEALFNALNVWFSSLKNADFFHADLHSGNLLLLDDGRVGFIDFGMVGKITPTVWQAAFMLFSAIGEADYLKMATAMTDVGMTKKKVNSKDLANDLQQAFANSPINNLAGNRTEASQLNTLSAIARRHGIRFPSAFTLLLKQLLYFDRYLQLLAPSTELFNSNELDPFKGLR